MKTVPSQHSTQGGDAQCQTTNEHNYGLNSLSFLKQIGLTLQLLVNSRKRRFQNQTKIGVTRSARMETILGKSLQFLTSINLLEPFIHMYVIRICYVSQNKKLLSNSSITLRSCIWFPPVTTTKRTRTISNIYLKRV